MVKHVLNKYLETKDTSTDFTPKEAHDDKNTAEVNANLQLRHQSKRKYPNISVNDYVNIQSKGQGKYISRKEYNSRWSENKFKVIEKGRDIMGNAFISQKVNLRNI